MNELFGPRQVLSYLGNLGSALPGAIAKHRGNFYWKRASAAEDELYAGVKDSSGVNQLRRILTKTYGDTLYVNINDVRFGTGSPEGVVTAGIGTLYRRTDGVAMDTLYYKAVGAGNTGWLPVQGSALPNPRMPDWMAPGSSVTNMVSNNTYAYYIGRAELHHTSIDLRTEISTAVATITWAEVGIGTAPAIAFAGAAAITRRGFTDVSASFNSTGEKTVTVAVSGITPGDHLWALFGSQATTPYQCITSLGDFLSMGLAQLATTTRISTMSSPKTFSVVSNATTPLFMVST